MRGAGSGARGGHSTCAGAGLTRKRRLGAREGSIANFAYVGYLAGALTVVSFIPQTLRVWRTKHTTDLSLRMFAILLAAGILWLTYGILSEDWPVVATNVGTVSLNLAILVAKLRYR